MVMPAAATILVISGCQIACSPISKNVALAHWSVSALSTAGVLSGHGPSSNVNTTSCSRRKSYCLKCSKPKAGPPLVSISTTRAKPMAPGLSQAGRLLAGPEPDWVALASAAPGVAFGAAVFCAMRAGSIGAGAGMATTGAPGIGAATIGSWTAGTLTFSLTTGAGSAAAGLAGWAAMTGLPDCAARCAATTPNAARPTVANAATTTINARTAPSPTQIPLRKSEGAIARRVNEKASKSQHRWREKFLLCLLRHVLLRQARLAAESVFPTLHCAGKGQRARFEHAARNRSRHHVGGERAEFSQREQRIAERSPGGRDGEHHIAVERRVHRIDGARQTRLCHHGQALRLRF